MKIVAGRLGGLALATIGKGDPASRLRPTSARTRTRIFDCLVHARDGDRVAGRHVLDLFAGTGALGLEALSRGAAHACFVDNGAVACRLIRKNRDLAGVADISTLLRRDATRLGRNRRQEFDLVFLDPPYGAGLALPALQAASSGNWLAPGCTVVIEDSTPLQAPGLLEPVLVRRSGNSVISVSVWPGDHGQE